MVTRPAAQEEATAPRLLVLDDNKSHDVFDVLGPIDGDGSIVRVRSPYLFEIGEELSLRIEQDGVTTDVRATVRAHIGPNDARITELEISKPESPET